MDHLLLHPHPSVTTAARHFVTDWARRHDLPEDTVDTLELLTSEVVANAVLHGDGDVLVSITDGPDPTPPVAHPHQQDLAGHHVPGATPTPEGTGKAPLLPVLVCVSDAGTGLPRPQDLTQDSLGGRGLALVEMLAHTWGVSPPTTPGSCYPSPPLTAAGLGGGTGGKTIWFFLNP